MKKNNKKVSLAYNQRKLVNEVALKMYNGQIDIEEAQRILVEKLDVKVVHFSKDKKIGVVIDDYNSQVLLCYERFEEHNVNDGVYGKINLSNKEKEIVLATAMKVFKGEISVEQANQQLKKEMDIEYAQFADSGKVYVQIDDENSIIYKYSPNYVDEIKKTSSRK